jgi:hypothetical protein
LTHVLPMAPMAPSSFRPTHRLRRYRVGTGLSYSRVEKEQILTHVLPMAPLAPSSFRPTHRLRRYCVGTGLSYSRVEKEHFLARSLPMRRWRHPRSDLLIACGDIVSERD